MAPPRRLRSTTSPARPAALATAPGNAAGQWHLATRLGAISATNVTLTATAGGTGPGPAAGLDDRCADRPDHLERHLDPDHRRRHPSHRVRPGASGRGADQARLGPRRGSADPRLARRHHRRHRPLHPRRRRRHRQCRRHDAGRADVTDIRAGDLATIAGRVLGRMVTIGSADIHLQATGAIGDAATALVVLEVAGGTTPRAFRHSPRRSAAPPRARAIP